eukprot:10157128-Alexandrium_andersonii.AAC.1
MTHVHDARCSAGAQHVRYGQTAQWRAGSTAEQLGMCFMLMMRGALWVPSVHCWRQHRSAQVA